jgi:hypothetical protein
MRKSMESKYGKKVSTEMSEVLNRMSGQIPKNRVKEVRALLVDRRLSDNNVRCTWWDGCYYCQDEKGDWKLISCFV